MAEAAQAGLVRNRSGDPYKPSALRGYEQSLRTRAPPGARRRQALRHPSLRPSAARQSDDGRRPGAEHDPQLADAAARDLPPALALDEVAVNPTSGVQLPAVRGKRERIASPAEAAQLIAALPPRTARCGRPPCTPACARASCRRSPTSSSTSIANVIRVQWSWDPKEGRVAPKSRAGRRTVPIAGGAAASTCSSTGSPAGAAAASSSAGPTARPFSNQALSQRADADLEAPPASSRSACTNAATPSPR